MMRTARTLWCAALALVGLTTTPVAVASQGAVVTPNNGPEPLPLGTTRGERVNRLVIRNATILSGRGTPGTNRGMPPEGPVDIVIENGVITNIVLMDPVNLAGHGQSFQRPTGDRIVDAT